jgi:hypothetical protein
MTGDDMQAAKKTRHRIILRKGKMYETGSDTRKMTVKPGVVGSLATIVVALALGLITSVVPGRIPAMRKSLSW